MQFICFVNMFFLHMQSLNINLIIYTIKPKTVRLLGHLTYLVTFGLMSSADICCFLIETQPGPDILAHLKGTRCKVLMLFSERKDCRGCYNWLPVL